MEDVKDNDIVLVTDITNGQPAFKISYKTYKNFKSNPKFKDKIELVSTDVSPVEKKKKVDAVVKKEFDGTGLATESITEEIKKQPVEISTSPDDVLTKDIKFTKSAEKLIEEKEINKTVFIGQEKVLKQDVVDYLNQKK